MSKALAVIDVEIPSPIHRPKGVTLKQWRLAALLPRAESAYAACIAAGYKPSTAHGVAKRTFDTVGVRRAIATIAERQADSARGLVGLSQQAFASSSNDIKELEPRDRLALGIKALETAATLGENLEVSGSSDAWRQRIRKAIRRGDRNGYNRGYLAGLAAKV